MASKNTLKLRLDLETPITGKTLTVVVVVVVIVIIILVSLLAGNSNLSHVLAEFLAIFLQ